MLDALLQSTKASQIQVATSIAPLDDAIASYCASRGVTVFRGDEENVASRFQAITAAHLAPLFARLNADSPLFDHRILDLAVLLAESSNADLVSTSVDRQYPSGMHVEVVRTASFQAAYPSFDEHADFEHVTRFFYRHQERFAILAVPPRVENAGQYRFTFDTADDRDRLDRVFAALERPHFRYSLEDKCAIHDRLFKEGHA